MRLVEVVGHMCMDLCTPCSPPVVVLSLELTCALCALLFVLIESIRLWDYALTVGVIHFVVACIGEWLDARTTQ